MPDLSIPDTNEFHPMEDYSGPVIVRVAYNTTADKAWAAGDADKAAGQAWWGAYQYVSKNADPAACARKFLELLGGRIPNVTILDLEEGDGDQQPRQHAWLDVMANHPSADWTYSGLYFARTHNLDNVQWIAAYGQGEPTTDHRLWQYADNVRFPGISQPCDASVFHGSLDDLIRLTGGNDDMTDDQAAKLNEVAAFVVQFKQGSGFVMDPLRAVIADELAKALAKIAPAQASGAVKVTGTLNLGG